MEFLHTQSRCNGSSFSQYSSASMKENVGLSICYDKPSNEAAHIVFNTRDLTKSLTKTNETSSNIVPSKVGKCLLSSHGLKRDSGSTGSLKPERFDHTLNLLPLTICTKHGNESFLPLDYVRKLPEYTRTTHNYPVFQVIHSFEDCVLEFPHPPPIGSSEEHLFQDGYMNKCYQCFTKLSLRRTVFMYRDYLFCCPNCRLKACATRYWYKKAMKVDDLREKNDNGGLNSTMEGGTIFTIEY